MLGNYQIALIVLLLLNFVFWMLIICWRIFLNKSEFRQPPVQRNRLRRTHYDNPVVTTRDEDLPSYSNVIQDNASFYQPPPSYEEVAKTIEPAPPYTTGMTMTSPTTHANYTPCDENSRDTRTSDDDAKLIFHDRNGRPIDVYTIPIEAPCYLVLDTERALRVNCADA